MKRAALNKKQRWQIATSLAVIGLSAVLVVADTALTKRSPSARSANQAAVSVSVTAQRPPVKVMARNKRGDYYLYIIEKQSDGLAVSRKYLTRAAWLAAVRAKIPDAGRSLAATSLAGRQATIGEQPAAVYDNLKDLLEAVPVTGESLTVRLAAPANEQ